MDNYVVFNLLADPKLPAHQFKILVENMTAQQIEAFSRLIKDFFLYDHGFDLTPEDFEKLEDNHKLLAKITTCSKPTNLIPELSQQGAGIFQTLLPLLAAVAGPVIKAVTGGGNILGSERPEFKKVIYEGYFDQKKKKK